MEYRKLSAEEITFELFQGFERLQRVTRCWRKIEGRWTLIDHPFVDQWSPEDYHFLVDCLRHTVQTGGAVLGAFENGRLEGFVSVENEPFGSRGQYLQLSSLHVSADCRRRGIGRVLFQKAAEEAARLGAEKLYISSHSAEETQRFYRAVGCVEALEYNRRLAEAEPCDCQLEYAL